MNVFFLYKICVFYHVLKVKIVQLYIIKKTVTMLSIRYLHVLNK